MSLHLDGVERCSGRDHLKGGPSYVLKNKLQGIFGVVHRLDMANEGLEESWKYTSNTNEERREDQHFLCLCLSLGEFVCLPYPA